MLLRSASSAIAAAATASTAVFTVVPAIPAAADPVPAARDIDKSKRKVRERAAEVGRVQSRIARANGHLRELITRAQIAVERYNGAIVRLGEAKKAHTAAQRQVASAEQRQEEIRGEVATFASDAYQLQDKVGSTNAAIGGPGGPQGYMDRAGVLQVLQDRRAAVMERARSVRAVAEMFRGQARRALAEQQRAARRAEAAKRMAAKAVSQQQAALHRIAEEKKRLIAQLGDARSEAAQLERRREAALAKSSQRSSGRYFSRYSKGSSRGAIAARAALRYLGMPYSWGGGNAKGPSYGIQHGSRIYGFDCSGLTLYAWAQAGVPLIHYVPSQWPTGPHPSRGQLRAGDLVFFARNKSNVDTYHHIGLYIGRGKMVEAPYTGARVRISPAFRHDYAGATRPAG